MTTLWGASTTCMRHKHDFNCGADVVRDSHQRGMQFIFFSLNQGVFNFQSRYWNPPSIQADKWDNHHYTTIQCNSSSFGVSLYNYQRFLSQFRQNIFCSESNLHSNKMRLYHIHFNEFCRATNPIEAEKKHLNLQIGARTKATREFGSRDTTGQWHQHC